MQDKLKLSILFVEDEPDLRERIRIVLEMNFEKVYVAANGNEGLDVFLHERPDLVVSDIKMPVMDGLEMTRHIRNNTPDTPIILTTAFTETSYLLQAIELGISSYVRKPLDCRLLVEAITQSAKPILQKIELDNARQLEQASLELLLGESPVMQDVIQKARRIADTNFSVIILGETGVGKSYLASLIHGLSRRKHNPFITVTVSSMPESLVESQLFGHLRGAFTGAVSVKKGLFDEAHGGTLFLDDIDCAPPAVQAKILHAVEMKRFFPVGSTRQVEVDTRIIAASNRDLFLETHKGNFREDLYYRLGDLVITIPPLRDRGSDITALARMFLAEISRELNRTPPVISSDALLLLHRHPWPGNVRELKSLMKRAALFAGETLTSEDIKNVMVTKHSGAEQTEVPSLQTLEELKGQALKHALLATDGKKMEAARLLDVEYSRFKRMLDKYKL